MGYFVAKWLINFLLHFSFAKVSLSENIHVTCTEDKNILKPKLENNRYTPNSVMSWHIIPSSKREGSMIEMTVKYLEVDDFAGDYVLIGGSSTNYGNMSDVFGGPKPLLLTGKFEETKTVLIASVTAYVVLVSKNSNKSTARGFEIHYQRSGASIPSVETESPMYDLLNNAISLCVTVPFNVSQEDVKNDVSRISSQLANEYNKKESIPVSIADIKVLSVSKRKDGSFYMLITITRPDDETKPLFTSEELRKILYNKNRNEYQLSGCKKESVDELEMSIVYAVIPVLLVFFLFVWWWRYNSLWNLKHKVREELKSSINLNVEMYPPQMINPIYQPDSPTSIDEFEKKFSNFVPDSPLSFNDSEGKYPTNQPDSPTNFNLSVKTLDFAFSDANFVPKENVHRTDSSSSWSPQVSARNKRISRKKFNVSFALPVPKNDGDDDADTLDDNDSVVSDTVPKTVPTDRDAFTKL